MPPDNSGESESGVEARLLAEAKLRVVRIQHCSEGWLIPNLCLLRNSKWDQEQLISEE